ncbi:hypothetical protein OPV22_008880 [Ensete ventricosum]|uniref:Pectinesterase n=1 Tax=Ensete ventricosum TaxID=4639 RepID=A0AAV8RHJ7_ENSVE|nr:hypothetical protein OPV22_008880 [Ensete ventricosum]
MTSRTLLSLLSWDCSLSCVGAEKTCSIYACQKKDWYFFTLWTKSQIRFRVIFQQKTTRLVPNRGIYMNCSSAHVSHAEGTRFTSFNGTLLQDCIIQHSNITPPLSNYNFGDGPTTIVKQVGGDWDCSTEEQQWS